jgi:hypothetical protein
MKHESSFWVSSEEKKGVIMPSYKRILGRAQTPFGLPELKSEAAGIVFEGTSSSDVNPTSVTESEIPAEAAQFTLDFEKAGGTITRVHSLERPPRERPKGMGMDTWKCREAARMCAEHLGTLAKLPKNVIQRAGGQTAIYWDDGGHPWDWNHSGKGFTDAFWQQIYIEVAKGHRIMVVQWPTGNTIYDSRFDIASEREESK